MASRWRIRHKLLLGVALVAGVMALLLGGSLRGLWSYYLTTNSIRVKLHELIAVAKVETAVAELVNPENVKTYLRGENANARFRAAVHKVKQSLLDYDEQLDPRTAVYEKAQTERLLEDVNTFRIAVEARMAQPTASGDSDAKAQARDLELLADPMKELKKDTHDLHAQIKKELDDRLSDSRRNYQMALWITVPSSIAGMVVMICLMWSFYGWVFYPIRDLEKGVKSLAAGHFDHTLSIKSGDEMEDLAVAFNDMARRLGELYGDLANQVNERSRQLVRSERLASVGFLAAGVAHEINNPLASIAFCGEALEARLEELLRHMRSSPRASEEHEIFGKYLRMIQEEAFRCKSITERLLEFSRTGEPRREPTDLRGLVQAVLDVTQHLPNHRGKRIVFEVPPERMGGRISAWINGEEIKSVILNLVINALESMDEEGLLTIRLAQRDGRAELKFIDTGCGMSAEVLENIFEPFYTRSRTGKGTGLGLTISHLVISQHGGDIEVSSAGVGQGSTFTVRLPIQPTESAQLTIGAAPATGPRLAA